jgi:hypothetical protein
MALSEEELQEIITELATRPGHEKVRGFYTNYSPMALAQHRGTSPLNSKPLKYAAGLMPFLGER